MNVSILYEDADLAVIDKPAGIIVNRADTTKHETTVQDWAEEHFRIKKQESGSKEPIKFGEVGWDPSLDFYNRGGVVHRLDKETSGVLILAKTPEAFVHLQKQFHDRSVKKTYQALAHGAVMPAKGEIHVPVGRLPWNRKQFGIVPGGRESKTLYEMLHMYEDQKTKEKLSLVELYPQSGRTHQIRVHLKYINHPIFSDFLYAGRKTSRKDRQRLERVFLHAAKIIFRHPTSGKTITVESPLPRELEQTLKSFVRM